RQCGDKWRRRYLAEGFAGLAAGSHAPHRCPHKIDQDETASPL
ncbi:MAG: IS481 family transposase, partial [Gemmatimonadetes bacterium]|nr:IS481 family transposase [Gemmatimonadota bacterium]